MRLIFAIEFEWESQQYSGIVRAHAKDDIEEYHVRIMNGRLDRLLYGHHVFRVQDGAVLQQEHSPGAHVQALHRVVRQALLAWLKNRVRAIPSNGKGTSSKQAS